MEKFNLEKALKGEPVLLRDGTVAYILTALPEPNDEPDDSQLLGYVKKDNTHKIYRWTRTGMYLANEKLNHPMDIISMSPKEQPKIQVTLPAPLKDAKEGQTIFIITKKFSIIGEVYRNHVHRKTIIDQGRAFLTMEDAKAWVSAFKDLKR